MHFNFAIEAKVTSSVRPDGKRIDTLYLGPYGKGDFPTLTYTVFEHLRPRS